MKPRIGSLFQTNAHSLARRGYFAVLQRLFAVFGKRQSVHFVRINDKRYKRVVFGDSHEASLVEHALCELGLDDWFPPVIYRHENELLLGFVEGRRFEPERAEDRTALAGFFGAVYANSRSGSPEPLQRRLAVDLQFLDDAGLLPAGRGAALLEAAERLGPAQLRIGPDYVDAVAKNFVVDAAGRLRTIDVESLREDQAQGSGVAKAAIHWLRPEWQDDFVAEVERRAGWALAPQLPYVGLCFRVGWVKRKLLQGKLRRAQLALLEPPVG